MAEYRGAGSDFQPMADLVGQEASLFEGYAIVEDSREDMQRQAP